jgi:23S rRNA pseudouridine1911/1915/1917 synthase
MNRIIIQEAYIGERLDHSMHTFFTDFTKSYIQKLIQDGQILVNLKRVKNGYIIKKDDDITYEIQAPVQLDIPAVDIPLDIIYEDNDLAIINKQKGLIVHPASTTKEMTLVSALMHHLSSLSSINGTIRPGIVHRIDKDTTGLLIIAKNNSAHLILSEMLKKHEVSRHYQALVHGHIPHESFSIDLPIARHPSQRKQMAVVKDGRRALTHVKVLHRYSKHTLVEISLETGRTHQIRVHMSHLGYPIVGDPLYGIKKEAFGQLLHAFQIQLNHPITSKRMNFEVPLPKHFESYLKMLDVS